MAQRLSPQPRQPKGLNAGHLRIWALLCLTLGTLGVSVFQNAILNLPNISGEALLAAMEADPKVMGYATAALLLQAICCCAAPLFAFLLTEGFEKSRSRTHYFLRVLGVAAVSELPYNLAASGKWLDTATRNPAFGLVLAMLMLYFFRHFGQKSLAHFAIKAVVAVAAVLWALMLRIDQGAPLVVLTLTLWLCRRKPTLRTVFGCVIAFACSLFSPFYLLSPMVFILLHLYNGEKGQENIWLKYAAYPAILLVLGIVGTYIL